MRTYRRGDVWLANLDPVVGWEQGKTRPVVIIQVVLLNQIRTIDKRRMIERWGTLGAETSERLDEALKISLGLVPI